ncbi:copper homeostasis protein CutC [Algoriphagus sediminis]|uniref:PF03932 family protein CutC n=1 Tax=Algoriphagus sediminis TaxID=3057113 RepID=A0ABT7YGU6_9BACT|nr:copper homeostasis protein CutC [Algoriphagus sediminis]MDN3205731.1 copper homeostasis protein CutC [Algoriphagus sediminis]
MGRILLEAPVFNLAAAIEAARFGVDRIELCANFPEGGETPSPGMLSFLKKEIDIPVFVMIRPRGGDFCYSEKEISVMREDIKIMKDHGADGFVFGILDKEGKVNSNGCEVLIRSAGGLPCTFHRAFDASSEFEESLTRIINLGFQRILTSGQKNTVSEGIENIERLLELGNDRIIIMPGGGSRPEHVKRLRSFSNFQEIHASCKIKVKSDNHFFNPEVRFSSDEQDFKNRLAIDMSLVNEFLEEGE